MVVASLKAYCEINPNPYPPIQNLGLERNGGIITSFLRSDHHKLGESVTGLLFRPDILVSLVITWVLHKHTHTHYQSIQPIHIIRQLQILRNLET